jgi:ParB-like chromosome segregation protein Spo0J
MSSWTRPEAERAFGRAARARRRATLPPISVIQVGDDYAIRDGHHRVPVAKALGAPSIRALVA